MKKNKFGHKIMALCWFYNEGIKKMSVKFMHC